MHIHHVIDAMKGAKGSPKLAVPEVARGKLPSFLEWIDQTSAVMSQAHAFEFRNVPVEPCGDGTIDLPGCEADELLMHNEGMLPLPYPVSWFEVEVEGVGLVGDREVLCFLIEEIPEGTFGEKGDTRLSPPVPEPKMRVTPFHYTRVPGMGDVVQVTGEVWFVIPDPQSDRPILLPIDEFGGSYAMEQAGGMPMEQRLTGESGLVLFLLVMLHSRTTETSTEAAPDKLNKARARKGKAALPSCTTVSIVPQRISDAMRRDTGERGDGTIRNSPRLHWRRSHVRTTKSGNRVPVCRHLVGYRDLDGNEVVAKDAGNPLAHEYVVKL